MGIYNIITDPNNKCIKNFKPTRLYIKRHRKTGLRYFGKHIGNDIHSYPGSGTVWRRHLNVHGMDIETEWHSDWFHDPIELQEFAFAFSELFDIVKSKEWANISIESGLFGGDTVSNKIWITDGVTDKYHMKDDPIPDGWCRGRTKCKFNDSEFQTEMCKRGHVVNSRRSTEEKKKSTEKALQTKRERNSFPDIRGDKNPAKRQEVKDKISKAANEKPLVTCPHCGKMGKYSSGMLQHHFSNCKHANN